MAAVDPNSVYYDLIKLLAAQIPEMAALLLGMICALARWGSYPRPALLSFLGFGLLMVASVLPISFMILGPRSILFEFPLFLAGDPMLYQTGVWAVRSFLCAGAYLLLIFAIYAARNPRAQLPPYLSEKRIQEVDR